MKCRWIIHTAVALMLMVMLLPLQSFGKERQPSDRSEQAELDAALIRAASKGTVQELQEKLRRKANPNATDSEGMTPLMHAALRGNREMVEILLQKGAHPNVDDNHGTTALAFAAPRQACGIDLLTRRASAVITAGNVVLDLTVMAGNASRNESGRSAC